MNDHIHLIQFGDNVTKRIAFGTYDGQPALFIEPSSDPVEIGTFGLSEPQHRNSIPDGSVVLRFARTESLGVLQAVVNDLAVDAKVQPLLPKLTEGACFVIEAAMQYGFTDDGEGTLTCTETQLINFIDAAREQGRRDVAPSAGPSWVKRAAWIARQMKPLLTKDYPGIPVRDPKGDSRAHMLWLLEELIAEAVGGETKTCRWLGYVQAGFVFLGIADLDLMKDLNMRAKEAARG